MPSFLIVGLDYDGTDYKLDGVANDIRTYQYKSIETDGECKTIRSISRQGLLEELDRCIVDAKVGDVFYFCFIGHGTQIDEKVSVRYRGINNAVVTYDGERLDIVSEPEIMTRLNSMRCNVVAFFDCSFANKNNKETPYGHKMRLINPGDIILGDDYEMSLSTKRSIYKKMVIFYASKDTQPAFETPNGGVFTSAFRSVYDRSSYIITIFRNLLMLIIRTQYPRIVYNKNSIKFKLFESNEIIRLKQKSNRRRAKKIKRERKQHEPSEARIWQP